VLSDVEAKTSSGAIRLNAVIPIYWAPVIDMQRESLVIRIASVDLPLWSGRRLEPKRWMKRTAPMLPGIPLDGLMAMSCPR
jgi:hypothetical protein